MQMLLALGLDARRVRGGRGIRRRAGQARDAPRRAPGRVGASGPRTACWPSGTPLALGADFIEFDVHLSKDGEPVVIHDPTLDRTTTGAGPVKDRTVAELKALRLKDRTGAVTEETVPTLDEVAAVAAKGKRRMLLEIKVDPSGARYPGIEEKVLAILDRHGMAAFDGRHGLRGAHVAARPRAASRRRDVRALLGPLARTARRWRPSWPRCARRACASSESSTRWSMPRRSPQARKAGIGIGAWTVNDAAGDAARDRLWRSHSHHRPAGPGEDAPQAMTARRFILALDQGTTGSRALVVDPDGAVRGTRLRRAAAALPEAGLGRARRRRRSGRRRSQAIGQALGAARSPRADDRGHRHHQPARDRGALGARVRAVPSHRAIVWQCRRTAPFCERLQVRGARGRCSGARPASCSTRTSPAPRSAGCSTRCRGAAQRAERGELCFGTVDSWLLWRLTRRRRRTPPIRPTPRARSASTSTRSAWDEELCEILGVPVAILPR